MLRLIDQWIDTIVSIDEYNNVFVDRSIDTIQYYCIDRCIQ